jgi:transcriptional regulator with XRE-family HTH domain
MVGKPHRYRLYQRKLPDPATFAHYFHGILVLLSQAWHGCRPVHASTLMAKKLPDYLRTHRLVLGLTQAETAFLLGEANKETISRYERSGRRPGLETLIAYEVLCGVTLRDLYAGTYEKVEQDVARRARTLEERLSGKSDAKMSLKLEAIRRVQGPNRAQRE